jgi:hypothetical protein
MGAVLPARRVECSTHNAMTQSTTYTHIGIGWDVGGWGGFGGGGKKHAFVAIGRRPDGRVALVGKAELPLPQSASGLLGLDDILREINVAGRSGSMMLGIDAPLGLPKEHLALLEGKWPSEIQGSSAGWYKKLGFRTADLMLGSEDIYHKWVPGLAAEGEKGSEKAQHWRRLRKYIKPKKGEGTTVQTHRLLSGTLSDFANNMTLVRAHLMEWIEGPPEGELPVVNLDDRQPGLRAIEIYPALMKSLGAPAGDLETKKWDWYEACRHIVSSSLGPVGNGYNKVGKGMDHIYKHCHPKGQFKDLGTGISDDLLDAGIAAVMALAYLHDEDNASWPEVPHLTTERDIPDALRDDAETEGWIFVPKLKDS